MFDFGFNSMPFLGDMQKMLGVNQIPMNPIDPAIARQASAAPAAPQPQLPWQSVDGIGGQPQLPWQSPDYVDPLAQQKPDYSKIASGLLAQQQPQPMQPPVPQPMMQRPLPVQPMQLNAEPSTSMINQGNPQFRLNRGLL
jgi:hypothetical protein